jgi:hypothetical protein
VHDTEPPTVEFIAENEYVLVANAAVSVMTPFTVRFAGLRVPV